MKAHTSKLSIIIILTVVAAGVVMPVISLAGTVFVAKTDTYAPQRRTGVATVYLDGELLRIDSTEGGVDLTVIYRSAGEGSVYWIIDNSKGTYIEITSEMLNVIRSQMDVSREQLQQQYDALPPDKQEMAAQMFQQRMNQLRTDLDTPEYKKVSEGTPVQEWSADHYQGWREGAKIEEVWAADWQDLGMKPADLTVFAELADVFDAMGQDMPAFFHFGRSAVRGETTVAGFPVMVVSYAGERPSQKTQLMEVRSQAIEAQLFELPEGLTKQTTGQ